jgi:hypothetical protein
VIQQSVGSNYLAALNSHGGSALVSTTSLYTLDDDIIQPEVGDPTSNLPGASVISVQGESQPPAPAPEIGTHHPSPITQLLLCFDATLDAHADVSKTRAPWPM